jgi:hypothetical protein
VAKTQTDIDINGPAVKIEQPLREEANEEAGSRRADPELLAMGRMLRLLDELDDHAKCRVVAWLSDRYRFAPPPMSSR